MQTLSRLKSIKYSDEYVEVITNLVPELISRFNCSSMHKEATVNYDVKREDLNEKFINDLFGDTKEYINSQDINRIILLKSHPPKATSIFTNCSLSSSRSDHNSLKGFSYSITISYSESSESFFVNYRSSIEDIKFKGMPFVGTKKKQDNFRKEWNKTITKRHTDFDTET